MTFNIRGAVPTGIILDEAHQWHITTEPAMTRPQTPPPCACGNRRDRYWDHAEEECTWRETAAS